MPTEKKLMQQRDDGGQDGIVAGELFDILFSVKLKEILNKFSAQHETV